MIDKDKHMRNAEQFHGEGDCYIHTEMKNGQQCETILAGDGLAILHGICGEISRVAQIRGATFEQTLEAIRKMYYMR